MNIKRIVRMFEKGNVCVTGLRGTGKDMLTSNVIRRRKKAYVSNINYGGEYAPIDFDKLDCGGNTYENFINGDIKPYECPYPQGSDYYVSDVGIIFPSQYCSQLNNKFKEVPTFMALSRQLAKANFHINTQNLNRCWDKIREQSDTYIRCRWCKVLDLKFIKIVFQGITLYDKYQSCCDRVKPCRVKVPLLNRVARMNALTYRDNFENTHGSVKNKFLIYVHKGDYNTYHFYDLLKWGKV